MSRFQAFDDSPSGKASYTLLTSPPSVHRGHLPPQHPSYLHPYGYGDMPLGMEKGSRSKVLPNEVYFTLFHFTAFNALALLVWYQEEHPACKN